MTKMRPFSESDIPALEVAIAADEFHQGEWQVSHFTLKHPLVSTQVIEDDLGPIAFVIFTKEDSQLRIACVWNNAGDNIRNARSIIFGIREAVEKARVCGLTEIVIATTHPPLAAFFERVMKMTKNGDDYVLAV